MIETIMIHTYYLSLDLVFRVLFLLPFLDDALNMITKACIIILIYLHLPSIRKAIYSNKERF
jgi:hypothetical protein